MIPLESLVKSKEGKAFVLVMGAVILTLTAMHYYHQIKLAKLNIEDKEEELKAEDLKKQRRSR